MLKQGKCGFLLLEALVALVLVTVFLASVGRITKSSWRLFEKGRCRMELLEKAVDALERGDCGEIYVINDCQYRIVQVGDVRLIGKASLTSNDP